MSSRISGARIAVVELEDFDAADSGIRGSAAFPGSADRNIVVAGPSRLDVAGPSTFRGASSPEQSQQNALKSIVAEIDSRVIETGSVGGPLLTRFAEMNLEYRIQANPIRGSILWKMEVPQIGQDPASVSEVPYILFVLQAEEFCDLIGSGFIWDHVNMAQSRYPTFSICYVTNKLMNYINQCERAQYQRDPKFNCWSRPPVEAVLSKLATHYVEVHSWQCADEAEVAEHVVGVTSILANY